MNIVHIYVDPDSVPLEEKERRRAQKAVIISDECTVVRLPKGTLQGNSTVAFVCDLPDNRMLFLEITMANFECIAAVFRGAEQRQREIDTC